MRRALTSLVTVALVATAVVAAGPRRGEQLCWIGPAGTVMDPTTTDPGTWPGMDECEDAGAWWSLDLEAFEPTMGAAPDGSLYYAITPDTGVALGWEASIAASRDGGQTWEDVRPNLAGVNTPPETNDPYAYVDPGTGRVFAFHMGPILTCSMLSWSDDGGATWDTSPVGCAPTGVWDHQTMVAARPVDGVDTFGYPNVLVQCVNAVYAAECGRSLDGGRTWHHTVPVHVNDKPATQTVENGSLTTCGAQHGHLAADEAGTIYLPTSGCGTAAQVWVSRDSGLTWTQSIIDADPTPFEDPAIAVDADGTVHAVWADTHGAMLYAASRDGALTWSEPVRVTPYDVTGKMPSIVAGDGGKVAFVFAGTDDYPRGYQTHDVADEEFWPDELEWGGFVTWTVDDGATWTTVEATGTDLLMRRDVCDIDARCRYQVDFIGSTVTPDGRVFGALIDGCLEECTNDPEYGNDVRDRGVGVAVTIPGLDLCEATCPRFPAGSGEAIDAGTPLRLPLHRDTGAMDPSAPRLEPLDGAAADLRAGYLLARDRFLA